MHAFVSCPLPLAERRRFLACAASAACLWPVGAPLLAQAQASPSHTVLTTAINRAARLRAFSQRIAKAYCQILLDMEPADAASVLASSRRLVRAGFDDLYRTSWPTDIGQQLVQLRQQFDALDAALIVPPTRESAAAASAQSNKVLETADALAQRLEKLSKAPADALVNLAGRQRMLSQRLAKNYFLAAAGLDVRDVQAQRTADVGEFRRALLALAQAPVTDSSIRSELTAAEMQWVFYDAALGRAPDVRGLRAVATASERMLEIMDNLTVKYEVALRDLRG